jgi:PAS domain S-box-containing protein
MTGAEQGLGRYRVAFTSVAVAMAARMLLDPVLGDHQPFIAFCLAVAVAARYGGLGPALLATALGALAGSFFFVPVRFSLELAGPIEILALVGYLVLATAIAVIGGSMRRAQERAEERSAELESARNALRESESEYRASFELAGVGQGQADPQTGRFLRVNERLCGITGYAREELVRRTYQELTHPEDREESTRLFGRLIRGEIPAYSSEKRYVRKGGSSVWVHVSVTLLRAHDGRPLRTIGVVQDVTERRQLADDLKANEERLRLAVEAANLGTWFWDIGAARVLYNDRARTMLGFRGVGDTSWEVFASRLHPEDLQPLLDEVWDALIERRQFRTEARFIWTDGSVHWIMSLGQAYYGADGSPERMFGVAIDITARKQMEMELEARVSALHASEQRKDEFLAMLSHELRNPLGPILNAVHLLRLIDPATPRIAEARDMIDRQARHMARLVDDLLDMSRIARGQVTLHKARIDLRRVVEQAVEIVRPAIQRQAHVLTVSLPSRPVRLEGDAERLVQVIANLLRNAAKFTEPHGHIALTAETVDGEVMIRVRDSGVGIPAEMLPRIFDLFVQEHSTIDRSQGGLGVGLTLARRLVELHGGRIEARSPGRGMGSEFIVRLPILPPALPLDESPEAWEAVVPERVLRVLVIEDNPDAAESFRTLLELEGHEARVACNGIEALEIAAAFVPDVAFLDIGLPGLDGYAVARRLRALPALRATILIAVSGYGRDEDRRQAYEAGFDHHLTKPADPGLIARLLAEVAAGGAGDVARVLQ